MGEGYFPKPVKIGLRVNAWKVEEIEAWLGSRQRAEIGGAAPSANGGVLASV